MEWDPKGSEVEEGEDWKKVKQLVEEQVKLDRGDDGDEPGRRSSGGAERERQIERLLKKAERVERWLQENGPKMGRQGREIKSNVR